jgi:hypothetical protein
MNISPFLESIGVRTAFCFRDPQKVNPGQIRVLKFTSALNIYTTLDTVKVFACINIPNLNIAPRSGIMASTYKKQKEKLVVMSSNTIDYPNAVVIHFQYAAPTCPTHKVYLCKNPM